MRLQQPGAFGESLAESAANLEEAKLVSGWRVTRRSPAMLKQDPLQSVPVNMMQPTL